MPPARILPRRQDAGVDPVPGLVVDPVLIPEFLPVLVLEPVRYAERVLPANRDQTFEVMPRDRRQHTAAKPVHEANFD